MSTANPTEVIAEALAEHSDDGCFSGYMPNFDDVENPPSFDEMDEWHSGEEDRDYWRKAAAHVVSVLAASGHTLAPKGEVEVVGYYILDPAKKHETWDGELHPTYDGAHQSLNHTYGQPAGDSDGYGIYELRRIPAAKEEKA